MTYPVYKFTFTPDVHTDVIAAAIVLASYSTESLHGEELALMDVHYLFDEEGRVCVVSAGTKAGADFARILTGFLRRELTPDRFRIERLTSKESELPTAQ